MNKIEKTKFAFWYQDIPNFGDILNPYLATKLFNVKLVYKHYFSSFYYARVSIANLKRKQKVKLPSKHNILKPWQPLMFGIGSILDYANRQSIIWGSGFREFDSDFLDGRPKEIKAVRGKLTIKRLKELNYNLKEDVAIGDPALLMPLVYKPSIAKGEQIGIVPHYSEYDFFKETYGDTYKVINMLNDNVEAVVDEIYACKAILSTSLHGVIIAHAYKVPALWIKNNYIGTGHFKFHDYFSSVSLPLYEPFTDIETILRDDKIIRTLFEEHKNKTLIPISLEPLQEALRNTFPK